MTVFLLLLTSFPSLLAVPSGEALSDGSLMIDFAAPEAVSYRGFTSYEIDGCSGMDDVHLPVRYVRLPIEPGTTPQVR
ncbi:MAG: hypothetical protein R6V62_01785, partial [Candidatus Fermentibacteraceae bacterium]